MSTDDETKDTEGSEPKASTQKPSSKSKAKAGSTKPKTSKPKATTRKPSSRGKTKPTKSKAAKSESDAPKVEAEHASGASDGHKRPPERQLAASKQDATDGGQTPLPLPPTDGKVTGIPDPDEITEASLVPEAQKVVCFELDGQLYGLPVEHVIEVTRMVAVTGLPKAPRGMLGVINLRGNVIPLLDLRQVLGLQLQRVGLNTPVVVAGSPGKSVGLVVDAVEGVRILPSQITPNELLSDVEYVSTIAEFGAEMLLVIDLEGLQSRFTSDRASASDSLQSRCQ